MPRIPRNIANTQFFHVMVQGIEKKSIFDNPVNMKKYIDLIEYNAKRINIDILAYCMMNNHAHILIKVKNIEQMTTFFRCVNTAYALYFNKINKRVGYVFRDRYRSEPIFTVKQLFNTINYIHNNPIKAGICKELEEYDYSSYNQYLKNVTSIINKDLLYKYFKRQDFNKIFKIVENTF